MLYHGLLRSEGNKAAKRELICGDSAVADVGTTPVQADQQALCRAVKGLQASGRPEPPKARQFSSEEIAAWVAEDHEDLDRFGEGE